MSIDISNWKIIPNCDRYKISRDGQVYSVRNNKLLHINYEYGRARNIRVRVQLTDNDGKSFKQYVHILVALTYIPNPENKPTVNHIDGDKWNNTAENLEWSTNLEQAKHSAELYKGQRLKRVMPVVQVKPSGFTIIYPSADLAASEVNVHINTIWRWIRKERNPNDGSMWYNEHELFINSDNEEWKPVIYKGRDTGYKVSSLGRVKNCKERILRGKISEGYIKISLCEGKKVYALLSAHRMVLESFVGPCPEGMSVDHINRNKQDNRLINLRYATWSEQVDNVDEVAKKLRSCKTKPVLQLDSHGNILAEFESSAEAAEFLSKKSAGNIANVCNKEQKTAYGFGWRYKHEIISN